MQNHYVVWSYAGGYPVEIWGFVVRDVCPDAGSAEKEALRLLNKAMVDLGFDDLDAYKRADTPDFEFGTVEEFVLAARRVIGDEDDAQFGALIGQVADDILRRGFQ